MNILERKKEIKLQIASNNVTEAIKRAMDYVEDFGNDNGMINEIVVISSNYFDFSRMSRQATADDEDLTKKRNRLLHQMLELLDAVETSFALSSRINN